jgi:hypothetical protein
VLQDTSALQQQQQHLTLVPTDTQNQHQSQHQHITTVPVLAPATCTYPEIEYVFLDDPNYETLEMQVNNNEEEQEAALVIELDEQGETVRRYCSLSPQTQVLGVRIKDRNLTKTIEVDVTRQVLEGVDELEEDDVGDLEYVLQLGALFTQRNQQLQSIMK